MICASFAASYGIRLMLPETRVSWLEFTALLCNLPAESPLARMVALRMDENEELSPGQRELRDEWHRWLNSQKSDGEKRSEEDQLQTMLQSLFYERREST